MKGKSTPKASSFEKKDMSTDKKQGIKENSKPDMSKDAMVQKLMSARGGKK